MSTRQDKSLHDACGKGQLRKVREILQNNSDIANTLDLRLGFLGYTPLHEAACQGHADILQLLLIYGGNVDAKANGQYTPLHIAASMDYVKCIKVLLKNGANIKAVDDFNKTPYQTAIQHKRKESAKCLKSAEIIREAGNDPQELNILLNETASKDITATCFDDALVEACRRGKFEAACMLLVAGAKKIKESICISMQNGHYRISALLLLCYAALKGDLEMLEMLLDKSLQCHESLQQFVDQSVPIGTVVELIRESLKNLEDYTSVVIKLPGLENQVTVLKDLLVNTSCRIKEKKVNWSKLSLSTIDESWLGHIKSWVQNLNLSRNKLTSLPECLVDLKMVVCLNLSENRLKVAPMLLFSLVSLRDLNLSGNGIAELPDVPQWRPALKSLNVSNNILTSLPGSIAKSFLETLNLSRNNFTRVPLSVCEILSLRSLDMSDNREISFLPNEMGKLRNLTSVNLKNLDQITDPPQHVRQNAQDLVATLRRRLRNCEPYYTMKLMLVGKGGQGKTTLVHRLRDDFTFKENDLTQGVEVSDLVIHRGAFERDFTFKVWDFGGQEDYYVTHQCFLSTMSLYLLVWRLIDGEEGVNGLIPWLDNIAVRSPCSTVIIVGTHLDCISPEKFGSEYVTKMEKMIRELVEKPRYKNRIIVHPDGICAVSCAFGGSRSEINKLRLIIYSTAANLKKDRTRVMGELIPSSFISLIDCIEKRKTEIKQQNELPIIRKEEFDAMVKENSLNSRRDIQEPMDVMDATIFLRERGVVMHFDDPNEGLSDLYFIEPRWLCALMARVITIKGHADLVNKDGVLEVQETKYLFRNDLPFNFYEQYLRLLVRFQIAYLLDASRVLVPSKLPEKEPEVVTNLKLPYAPVRRIYKINFQWLHGFWPRFMSRFFFYVKEMIAVDATRYQKAKDREHGFFGYFCGSCLRVDTGSTKTFPCFMDITEWETRAKSEESERISRESSQSEDLSTKEPPEGKYSTTDDSSTKNSLKKDSLKSKSSRKSHSKKLLWGKDASKRESSKKDSSRKKSMKKDGTKREPMKIENFEGDYCDNKSMPDPTMLGDDFHALLLNPSVKIFSDEELLDDTDGDRVMINQVDTAMDYRRRTKSFHDKKTESVKRVGMNLRIASFDGSFQNSQKSTTASEEKTQSSDSSEKSNKSRKSRKLPGKEEANQGDWSSSEPGSNMTDGFPNTTDDQPNRSEDASSSIEPVPMKNEKSAKMSEQNLSGHEDQPKVDTEHLTSDQTLEDEPVETSQVDVIVDDDSIDNIDCISETIEGEKVGIKIPTVNSLGSDDNKSSLSCSDVCSLSSWMETKGLPSFITASKLNENEPLKETKDEDDNVALRNPSSSNNHSQESFSGQGVISSPQDCYNIPQNQAVCHVSKTASKMETQYERLRNSVSQSTSTTSSVRSDEPTDSDCEAYSESISSASTTNINNPLAETNHPKEYSDAQIQQNSKGSADGGSANNSEELKDEINRNENGDQTTDDVLANLCDVTDSGVNAQSSDPVGENLGKFSLQSNAADVQSASGIHPSENDGNKWEFNRTQLVNVVDISKSENKQPDDDFEKSVGVGEQSKVAGEQSESVGEQSEGVGEQLVGVGEQSEGVGEQSGVVGDQPESVHVHDLEPESGNVCTETVETQKCTLCKENVAINELVAIPLDVAELIERNLMHCWRSGVCFSHLGVFLAVVYRPLSDSIVVEIAASPNPLGRRLLTFVVDHLDTLIKEWYPGIQITYGAEPTVQKLIPCRTCEKNGNPKPHMLTFDSCVTQYSMGNFVKCPEHEVNIQDIAPDVVLQDIDADLLLEEDEIEYERSEANIIGAGGFGKVYRGRCRQRDAAIKEYSSATGEQDAMDRYCEVRKEVNILRRLGQHPFLVNLIGVCLRPFRLVLELAVEGNLAENLFNPQFQIERIVIFRMLYQIADALSFLHTLCIIYRDLKPQNVLVMSYKEESDINIKLTDFGTAAFQFNEGLHELVGSPGYHAPEMLKEFRERTGYNEKVDVFALGILMSGFITRRQPFSSCILSYQVNDMTINGRWPEYNDITSSRIGLAGLTWLMESCLAYEPSLRHPCSNIAEQLRSTSFQLFLGIIALPCPQSVRHVCLVPTIMELWVAVDDKAGTQVFVYELRNWCLKKSFPIVVSKDGPSVCLQANCMHVNATDVLIGLRGDQDIVAIYDAESYKLKTKITLEEPVFSLSSNDFYIYLGMSSGICLVANRTKPILSIELSHSEPVKCITTVGNEYIWFAAGKCLQIFHAEGNEKTPVYELNAVRFNASSAPFSQTVLSESDIWCISKGDSIVTAWNISTRQKSLEIDCKTFLSPECDSIESAVICVLPVLNTVWIGMGGGKLLIVDADSGELITSFKLFHDHVRTLTLVPGPGPCGTEKYYVVVSGRNVVETALSAEARGKHVCRLNSDVIKTAPGVQITPVKSVHKRGRSLRSPFGWAKAPVSDSTNSDVSDAVVNGPLGGVLVFFEALPAEVLRRTESK